MAESQFTKPVTDGTFPAWDLRCQGPRMRRPPTEEEMEFRGGPRGPQVLPGAYTVRLTVGDKSLERRVEVRLDRAVSVSTADLKAQLDAALKLRDSLSAGNDAVRALDSVRSQIEQIQKTVKDRLGEPPQELTALLADYLKQTGPIRDRMARDPDAPRKPGSRLGARLVDRIGSLYSGVEGPDAARAPYQVEAIGKALPELDAGLREVSDFLTKAVPKLNEGLRKFDAPTVMPGKAVDQTSGAGR